MNLKIAFEIGIFVHLFGLGTSLGSKKQVDFYTYTNMKCLKGMWHEQISHISCWFIHFIYSKCSNQEAESLHLLLELEQCSSW